MEFGFVKSKRSSLFKMSDEQRSSFLTQKKEKILRKLQKRIEINTKATEKARLKFKEKKIRIQKALGVGLNRIEDEEEKLAENIHDNNVFFL